AVLIQTPESRSFELLPRAASDGSLGADILEVSMGPQHPSTHGVFRMDVALDGERVVKLKPVFGYPHRNHEKIAENTTYLGSMPFGGCRCDLPAGWIEQTARVVEVFPHFLDEFEALLNENEILMSRTQGVGLLPRELAINAGITGPMLRAAGVDYDLRKVDHYGIYDRFKFRVPLGDHGDVYDRYMVRVLEMRESLEILEQAIPALPPGPIVDPKAKLRGFRPKVGEAYGRIEAPKA